MCIPGPLREARLGRLGTHLIALVIQSTSMLIQILFISSLARSTKSKRLYPIVTTDCWSEKSFGTSKKFSFHAREKKNKFSISHLYKLRPMSTYMEARPLEEIWNIFFVWNLIKTPWIENGNEKRKIEYGMKGYLSHYPTLCHSLVVHNICNGFAYFIGARKRKGVGNCDFQLLTMRAEIGFHITYT